MELPTLLNSGNILPTLTKSVPTVIPSPTRSPSRVLPPVNEAVASISQSMKSFQKVPEIKVKGLSGIKDIDLKILSELNDHDLFSLCLADKHVNQMCKDEHFWRNRFISRFGQVDKPRITWRKQYLTVVSHLDKWSRNPWKYFDKILWPISNPPHMTINSNKDKITFSFLELGKEITLYFPVDRHYKRKYVKRVYKKEKDFIPMEVLNIIYNFYQEPISIDEYTESGMLDIRSIGNYILK